MAPIIQRQISKVLSTGVTSIFSHVFTHQFIPLWPLALTQHVITPFKVSNGFCVAKLMDLSSCPHLIFSAALMELAALYCVKHCKLGFRKTTLVFLLSHQPPLFSLSAHTRHPNDRVSQGAAQISFSTSTQFHPSHDLNMVHIKLPPQFTSLA